MKLATYQDGSRDGQLVVVSRDLATAHYASQIVQHLQQALDDWNFIAPQLQDVYDALNASRARHAFPFDSRQCMAPLPRAHLWAQGDVYDGGFAAGPEAPFDAVLAYGAGGTFAGACEPVRCPSEQMEADFGAGLAVVTADIAARASPEQALDGVRLLMLVNDTRLRATGLQPVQRHLVTACSPVAVTPDELGTAWQQGRLQRTLQTHWNGRRVGMADAGDDMQLHFGELIARLCATRPLGVGSVVGAGPVRNRPVDGKGGPQWPKGSHSLLDKRAIEMRQDGQASTGFLRVGDTVRVEMKGDDGASIFGAIDQEVVALDADRTPPGRRASTGPATSEG
jgi:fumarylacetoacetate (FAA) hydrolase